MKEIIHDFEVIDTVDYNNYGFLNGKKCFVKNSVVGDVVNIEIEKENKNYYFANIIDIIKPSKNRTLPFCEYFGKCGGCDLQFLEENYYYDLKKNELYNNFLKNGFKIDLEDIEIFKTGKYSRRRINLKYSSGKYGFFKNNSNEIVEFKNCQLIDVDIQKIVDLLRKIKLANLNSVDITKVDNGIALNFIFNKDPNIKDFEKLNDIKEKCVLISYLINDENIFFTIYKKENPIVNIDGKDIVIPEKCFLQATKKSQDFMIEKVKEYTKGYKVIADLYCGIGTYSYPLCDNAKVFSYEGNNFMIENFKKNKSNIQAFTRDLFNQPLTNSELNNFDLVVIDPPRNGAENQVKYLNKSKVKRIIYISCSVDALMRDLKVLKDTYEIKKVFLIDQFYMTKHCETVVIIDKI